jgi:hypothetical protein
MANSGASWPWWVFSTQATNLIAQVQPANATVAFPYAAVKPGTANADNGWICTDPGGLNAAGGFFYTTDSLMRASIQWVAAVDILGTNNATLNMGLDTVANLSNSFCFNNNVNTTSGDYMQFRKKSTDTNWQAVSGKVNGGGVTETSTDIVTGGGTMPGAGVFATFRITWDGTAGSTKVTYFVNNVQVAQHTNAINGALSMRFAFGGKCTAASAGPTVYMGGVKAFITDAQ